MLRNRQSKLRRNWSAARLVGLILNASGTGDPESPTLSPRRNHHSHNITSSGFFSRRPLILRYWRVLLAVVIGLLAVRITLLAVSLGKQIVKCHLPRPEDDSEGFNTPFYHKPVFFFNGFDSIKRPQSQCATDLKVPQIALMFLVKNDMPHEGMWEKWFEAAAGKLPDETLRSRFCTGPNATIATATDNIKDIKLADGLPQSCLQQQQIESGSAIDNQHLFDVWVHPLKTFTGYPEDNIFHGREIPPTHRATTFWGTHTLIDAARALLGAALTNPLNTKFILLSESDVPLYSPLTVYRQLMTEQTSRMNACNRSGWETEHWSRFRDDFRAAGLQDHHWRKSWQWFSLTRQHAEIVLQDKVFDKIFRERCRDRWDEGWCHHRVCYSDEHYMPTLLASLGLDNETDCAGELTDRDWSRVPVGIPHPYEYPPLEVNATLFHLLRHPEREGCEKPPASTTTATASFVNIHSKSTRRAMCATPPPPYVSLTPLCPLLARKFLPSTADAVIEALLPCDSGLRILHNEQCEDGNEEMQVDVDELKAEIVRKTEEADREWRRKNSWWYRKGWKWVLVVVGVVVLFGFVIVEEHKGDVHHKSSAIKVFSLLD